MMMTVKQKLGLKNSLVDLNKAHYGNKQNKQARVSKIHWYESMAGQEFSFQLLCWWNTKFFVLISWLNMSKCLHFIISYLSNMLNSYVRTCTTFSQFEMFFESKSSLSYMAPEPISVSPGSITAALRQCPSSSCKRKPQIKNCK